MPFTPEELTEMAAADAEIEAEFRITQAEWLAATARDREAKADGCISPQRKKAEYGRRYRQKNRELINENARKTYQDHREARLSQCKKYNAEHREERREYQKTYYAANAEQEKARQMKWRAEHPDEYREYQKAYRQKKREEKANAKP